MSPPDADSAGVATADPPATGAGSRRRALWSRVLLAHRRYTGRYGDALASGVAYATLLGSVPAAVLLGAALPGPAEWLAGGARVLLPGTVVDLAADLPLVRLPLRLVLVVALAWAALRLVRATRTSVRAMCAQPAGTGNPVRDLAVDLWLGAFLGVAAVAALAAVSGATLLGGRLLGLAVAVLCWAGALILIPRVLTHSQPGRPSWRATSRPAAVGATLLVAVTLLADGYIRLTEQLHSDVYRGAGVLVGVAVWVSVSARLMLRTVAWAATAEPRE